MQMQPYLIKQWDDLEYQWINSWKSIVPYKCNYVHPGTSCIFQFFNKLVTVCKIGIKYYVFFHLIPLVLRIKKSKTNHQRRKVVLRTLYEYAKSVLFMSFLVGFTKGALCIKSQLSYSFDGYFSSIMSVLAGSSILWEERSRQRQIGYFILAKAIRSFYVMLKRAGIWSFSGEAVTLHVVMMAILSYIFHHQPALLKFKETFQLVWAKD